MSDSLRPEARSLSDWGVAALLAEHPAHGFEIALTFAKNGPLGEVWTIRRQQVYRALAHLEEAGVARPVRAEESPSGPMRTVYELTDAGATEVDAWLQRPVERLRDVRHALLLKLALLERRGLDARPLVRAQRASAHEMVRHCRVHVDDATGPERIVVAWRLESGRALLRLLARWPADK